MPQSPEPDAIELRHISKDFDQRRGDRLKVLDDIDLIVPAHSIVALLGPSGCGKSTLLNIIAGLIRPDTGRVALNGRWHERLNDQRPLTYMFQEDRLLPWRTAARNVGFGLEAETLSRGDRQARIAEVLDLVGLGAFANAYPHELSGGMRSRVALARSLVTRPSIILMDEPFSKLDPNTRAQLHGEVLRIKGERATTLVVVTHDVEEAVTLADQVVVMQPRPGRVRDRRTITIAHPRDPLDREVAEAVRSLRVALASAPAVVARAG